MDPPQCSPQQKAPSGRVSVLTRWQTCRTVSSMSHMLAAHIASSISGSAASSSRARSAAAAAACAANSYRQTSYAWYTGVLPSPSPAGPCLHHREKGKEEQSRAACFVRALVTGKMCAIRSICFLWQAAGCAYRLLFPVQRLQILLCVVPPRACRRSPGPGSRAGAPPLQGFRAIAAACSKKRQRSLETAIVNFC